jgi:hypothetical protein
VKHEVLIGDISLEVFIVVMVQAYDRIGPEDGSSILLSNISIHLQGYTLIIIIIVIGKTALFEPQPFSEDSVRCVPSHLCDMNRDHPVFTFLDVATIFFLQSKVVG